MSHINLKSAKNDLMKLLVKNQAICQLVKKTVCLFSFLNWDLSLARHRFSITSNRSPLSLK